MSNYLRNQKRLQEKILKLEREKKEISKEINNSYAMEYKTNFYRIGNSIDIIVTSYNKNYFQSNQELIQAYYLVFNDFIEFQERNLDYDFMNFIKDSVENNIMLSDSIKEQKFKIKNDCILFNYDGNEVSYINQGSFIISDYEINVCNSYLFIYDKTSNKKYMYYGD